jgi:ankyrin repeat protein
MLSPLFDAVARRDEKAVRRLLIEGADPNTISPLHGQSVLYNACITGDAASARALLESGADLNAQDSAGTTALMKAALFGKVGAADTLLRNSAATEIRQSGGVGRTALELAEAKLRFWRDHIGDPGMKQDRVQERIRAHEAIIRMVQRNGTG